MKIIGTRLSRYRKQEDRKDGASYGGEIQVVEIETDNGLTGRGFATASPASGPLLAAMIENVLGPALVEADPWLTGDLWQRMYETLPRRGGEGLARIALSALDFALWDLKGKSLGVPISTLFGGRRELVPTYANCAHHLPADKLAERAAEYVAKGHRALKIRGTRTFVTPAEATERVRQVRAAVGSDVRIMVDVNGTWDVDTAVQQLKLWERYDVYWLEEPVPPQDLPAYTRVRARAGRTYIAGGEQHAGVMEFRALIEGGCVDVLQPNAAITGGITDWLRIHSLATAYGVPLSPWNLQPIHLHMAAGLPNVQWIEYFMPDNALLAFQTELFTGPKLRETRTDEGIFLMAPDAPGIGLELDPELADRCRVRN